MNINSYWSSIIGEFKFNEIHIVMIYDGKQYGVHHVDEGGELFWGFYFHDKHEANALFKSRVLEIIK